MPSLSTKYAQYFRGTSGQPGRDNTDPRYAMPWVASQEAAVKAVGEMIVSKGDKAITAIQGRVMTATVADSENEKRESFNDKTRL